MSTEVAVTLAVVLVPMAVAQITSRSGARRRSPNTLSVDPGGQAPHDEPDEAA